MTQEEKAEAYDEAIERARKWYDANTNEGYRGIFEDIFPELKESEDERIRKDVYNYLYNERHNIRQLTPYTDELDRWLAWLEKQKPINISIEDKRIRKSLINYVKAHGNGGDFTKEKYIAWLEKQGDTSEIVNKKKIASDILRGAAINLITWIDYNAAEGNMCLSNMECKDIEDALVNGDWGKIYAYMKKKLEKQGEQKPIDKVEPKFKVGDWIVYNRDDCSREIIQVYDIRDGRYYFTDNVHFSWSIKECDEKSHLWTIQDAKDGDVLSNGKMIVIFKHFEDPSYRQHIVAHIGLDTNGDIQITDDTWNLGIDKAKPATKEQRDQLEKAMAGAGWEFDFEKKELKKIHVIDEGKSEMDYCFTKMMNGEKVSPTWSEDDERICHAIICDIANDKSICKFEISKSICDEQINWLKSLKQRIGG